MPPTGRFPSKKQPDSLDWHRELCYKIALVSTKDRTRAVSRGTGSMGYGRKYLCVGSLLILAVVLVIGTRTLAQDPPNPPGPPGERPPQPQGPCCQLLTGIGFGERQHPHEGCFDCFGSVEFNTTDFDCGPPTGNIFEDFEHKTCDGFIQVKTVTFYECNPYRSFLNCYITGISVTLTPSAWCVGPCTAGGGSEGN